jgi:hypothetical protein
LADKDADLDSMRQELVQIRGAAEAAKDHVSAINTRAREYQEVRHHFFFVFFWLGLSISLQDYVLNPLSIVAFQEVHILRSQLEKTQETLRSVESDCDDYRRRFELSSSAEKSLQDVGTIFFFFEFQPAGQNAPAHSSH